MASKESKRRKTRPDARSTPDPKNAGYLPGEGLPDYLRSARGPVSSLLGIPAILGAALVGFSAYFVAEGTLAGTGHPWHWLAAAVGAGIGLAVGAVVNARRR